MSQKLTIQAKGLWTNVNALGLIPEGGLLRADNVVIHKPGIISPCRGWERLNELTGLVSAFVKVFQWQNGFIGISQSPQKIYHSYDFTTWTEVISFDGVQYDLSPVSGARSYYGFEMLGFFYLNTISGQVVIEDPTTGYRMAGVPPGLNTNPSIVNQGTGTAIPSNCQVAYRIVFGYRTETGYVQLGAPSQRGLVISAGGTVLKSITNSATPAAANGARYYNTGNPAANWLYIDFEKPISGLDYGTLLNVPTLAITAWYVNTVTQATPSAAFQGTRVVCSQNWPPPQTPPPVDPAGANPVGRNATDIIITAQGNSNVKVNFTIPEGIVPGKHFYQIHRTPASPSSDVDPGDDMGLVHEDKIPANISPTNATRTGGNSVALAAPSGHGYVTGESIRTVNDITAAVAATRVSALEINRYQFVQGTLRSWYFTDGVTPNVGSTVSVPSTLPLTDGNANIRFSKTYGVYTVSHPNSAVLSVYDVNFANPTTYDLNALSNIGTVTGIAAHDISPDGRYVHCIAYRRINALPAEPEEENFGWVPGAGRYIVFDLRLRQATYYGMGQMPTNCTAKALSKWGSFGITQQGSSNIKFHIVIPTMTMNMFGQLQPTGTSNSWFFSTIDYGSTWQIETVDSNLQPYKPGSIGSSSALKDYYLPASARCLSMKIPAGTANNRNAGNTVLMVNDTDIVVATQALTHLVFTYDTANSKWIRSYVKNETLTLTWMCGGIDYSTDGVIAFTSKRQTKASVQFVDYQCWYSTNYNIDTFNFQPVSLASNVDTGSAINAMRSWCTLSPNSRSQAGTEDWTAFCSFSEAGPNSYSFRFSPDNVNTTTTTTTLGVPTEVLFGFVNEYNGPLIYSGQYVITSTGAVPYPNTINIASSGTNFGNQSITATFILASRIFTDVVADGLIGPLLYTSPSRQGIEQSNYRPPLARDCVNFRTYAFYANITQVATLECALLSVSSNSQEGLQVADFIKVGDDWLEAATAEDFPNLKFKVYNAEGSAFYNISRTVRSIIACINANTFRLKVTATPIIDSATPGRFFIQGTTYQNNINFEVRRTSKTGALNMLSFSPHIPTTVTPSEQANLLYYSKDGQPGAVPLLNAIRVGSDSKRILRIEKTREILFILKEDGIFALRGYSPPWQVDIFDPTVKLAFPDSVTAMDNNLFLVANHGVMRITDSGASLLSLPIQNLIEEQLSFDRIATTNTAQREHTAKYCFSLADPSDHKWYLWLPEPGLDDAFCSYALVYDTYTEAWTRRVINRSYNPPNHAVLNSYYNKVFYATIEGFYRERRTYTRSDYISNFLNDSTLYAITYKSTDGYTIELNGNPVADLSSPISIYTPTEVHGDSDIYLAVSIATVGGNKRITLDKPYQGVVGGSVLVGQAMDIGITFAPHTAEAPSSLNHYREINLLFREAYFFNKATITTYKTLDPLVPSGEDSDSVDIEGINEFKTGGATSVHHQTRTLVPRNQQRTDILTIAIDHKIAMGAFEIEGITVLYNKGPDRSRRR